MAATDTRSAPLHETPRDKSSQSRRIDLSLDRIRSLLQHLGDPQHKYPVIHVAGTNGKGSTIAYLDAILRNVVGVKTGSFTSPHLITQRDSCRLSGNAIDGQTWKEAGAIVDKAGQELGNDAGCTPFEVLTAQSFVAFSLIPREQRPDVLLIEVGMGGALDATNVFAEHQVLASVICAIDLDHQAFLGDTLGKIALQKAGIVKSRGLCVFADQRRQGSDNEKEVYDVLRVEPQTQAARTPVGEIVEAVRSVCAERHARLVMSQIPWQDKSQIPDGQVGSASQPRHLMCAQSLVRFSPTLAPSKARPGNFVAATGESVVGGPSIQLPVTRAAFLGAHLALQTLWSIARDETRCGLGLAGIDTSEELRLAIAFALRDEKAAHESLASCIADVQLAGRTEWRTIALPPLPLEQANSGTDAMGAPSAKQPAEPPLTSANVLIDGAHNPAAALALGQYVRTYSQQLLKEKQSPERVSQFEVTWILAFSEGKDILSIINAFLETDEMSKIGSNLQSMHLDDARRNSPPLRHHLAFVPFSTPVEGMPWVKSVAPNVLLPRVQELRKHRSDIADVKAFPDHQHGTEPLLQALQWAKVRQSADEDHSIVIAGSLYLVSDAHRLISAANVQ